MALYVNGNKVFNSLVVDGEWGVIKNLKLKEGKINLTTGAIVADSDYYYTDEFPCPNGTIMFDFGVGSTETYTGVISYDINGNRIGSANTSSRYRTVDLTSVYSQGARTLRLSFPKNKFNYATLVDYVSEITYTTNTPVVVGNEHYQWGSREIDYIESLLVSTDTSEAFATEVFYATYSNGVLTRVKYSRQEGGTTVTLGDFQSYIGDSTSWLWRVTALADMEIRVDDITNGTQGQRQQVHSSDIILSGVPITGLYQYEIKRYS